MTSPVGRRPGRSAARSPTRRRRRRRPSRPGRRSGRGRTAPARGSAASASSVGVPATAAVGCSAAIRSSEVEPSLSVPSTSVARCQRFGSFSVNGISLVREWRGVRAERGEHALHGELVLVAVLRRGGQGEGGGRGRPAASGPAGDRAGEHAGVDLAVVGADQGLGAGADEAVDGVGPAVGVAERRARASSRRRSAPVRQPADQIAGEHHLARARGRRCARSPARPRPRGSRRVERAGQQRDAVLRAERTQRRSGISGAARLRRSRQMRVTQHWPSSRPTMTSGTISTLVWLGRVRRRRRRRTRAGRCPVRASGSVTVARGDDVAPGGGGIASCGSARRTRGAARLADAGEALAAAHPEQRVARVEERIRVAPDRRRSGSGWSQLQCREAGTQSLSQPTPRDAARSLPLRLRRARQGPVHRLEHVTKADLSKQPGTSRRHVR